MRLPLLILLMAFCLSPFSQRVEAQSTGEPAWTPARSSLAVGVHQFVGDGESSWRVGIGWYFSPQLRTTVTGRFWDQYDLIEAEGRWIRATEGPVRPFATASGLWQQRPTRRSFGGTVGGGVEFYLMHKVVSEVGLVWQSLFHPPEFNDSHWFRLNAGISFVPFH